MLNRSTLLIGSEHLFRNRKAEFIYIINLKSKIKSSLYSRNYAEMCNERRGPSRRHGAWTTQKRCSGVNPLATLFGLTILGIERKRTKKTKHTKIIVCLVTSFVAKIYNSYFSNDLSTLYRLLSAVINKNIMEGGTCYYIRYRYCTSTMPIALRT